MPVRQTTEETLTPVPQNQKMIRPQHFLWLWHSFSMINVGAMSLGNIVADYITYLINPLIYIRKYLMLLCLKKKIVNSNRS
jgi:hypothetical protein